ncbi:DUF6577 family protein [Hymenobacter sp.]|jgi:hypothetical protein|uniref:DUF6577 family protein n=1 Tax=Hymenobacter sp. TaxID=1898978 RepID=UPI002ED7F065
MEEQEESAPKALKWLELRNNFAHQPELTRAQVLDFYRRHEPEAKQTTVDWRIYELTRRGLLVSLGRGRYSLAGAAQKHFSYLPELTSTERNIWRTLVKELQLPEGCLWSTAWANEFSLHQAARNFLIVEVPRDYVQAVFYVLKDRHSHRVFLRPDPEILTYYVAETDKPIIVMAFVSRAPVQQVNQVPVPRLEKMLVDLFSSPNLFAAYQGRELEIIFGNARRYYTLDERTLLSYAQRRHKAPELRRFLSRLPDWPHSSNLQ